MPDITDPVLQALADSKAQAQAAFALERQQAAAQAKAEERTDIMSEAEYERRCAHYANYAFATPPDRFLFHYYQDDPTEGLMAASRPMPMEKYVVQRVSDGGYCGTYSTRNIMRFIAMGTWIKVDSKVFFARQALEDARRVVAEKEAALQDAIASPGGDPEPVAWSFIQ